MKLPESGFSLDELRALSQDDADDYLALYDEALTEQENNKDKVQNYIDRAESLISKLKVKVKERQKTVSVAESVLKRLNRDKKQMERQYWRKKVG